MALFSGLFYLFDIIVKKNDFTPFFEDFVFMANKKNIYLFFYAKSFTTDSDFLALRVKKGGCW